MALEVSFGAGAENAAFALAAIAGFFDKAVKLSMDAAAAANSVELFSWNVKNKHRECVITDQSAAGWIRAAQILGAGAANANTVIPSDESKVSKMPEGEVGCYR